ncbi:hypothetical protein GQ44DRAFT_831459 [Phaeosphaeriaceae sp. PMI808]|nr:hypothetical protein GQ44DRAFT_831459 [Phaeosphaeriaceae sp. PMI808]
MSTQDETSSPIVLPSLPVDHAHWISYVASHEDVPLQDLLAPYKAYDSELRKVFAQQPEHLAIETPNIVPIFSGHETELKIRARNLAVESEAERECYIMPLKEADRKTANSPAIVPSLIDFQTNFQLFSESSLVDLDWSNVVAAGSAVVTSLLPVPKKHNVSKRALRQYYHQQLAPASDVDLFLYGLTEEQAVEKIKQIEQRIRDSILTETTTVRTKNAITIVSQYPTRHVQVVLRIYRSISEILTGFDVDCSCAAYDGSQVYASPRALAAYMTQVNTIDLTRRSPSYENRLSKYSHRGFEVYWPLLDRSRIDPTLFERSFGRTQGLARLLVLEKLPKSTDRDAYVDQRREERGRPAVNRWSSSKANMKEAHEDEVAEWVELNDVSDYHTFTIPYGPTYHPRKIEKMLYGKDLLLNAEWNRPKDRETTLHRHPAFFGNAVDVIGDCCGYCPEPVTSEDHDILAEESKIYVSGAISFLKDNPGRQAIGSFNPITDRDWTEMAYVGNTARLCQAIVEGDIEHVQDWLQQEGADVNQRDYTGRTPLHLAVMNSTPEIVQCLIDGGARIVARLFDGKTALHLAAMYGEVAMVKALLIKSEANEEEENEKEEIKRKSRKSIGEENQEMVDITPMQLEKDQSGSSESGRSVSSDSEYDEDDDVDMLEDESEIGGATTENSIFKIDTKKSKDQDKLPEDADADRPDVYDVNVLAWDTPVSALHLAIANGHIDVVECLVQDFGADVLLPIKLMRDHEKSPRAAILPIVLALYLPPEKAEDMTKTLMRLGASPAQADISGATALQYFVRHGSNLLSTMISADRPAAQRAVGHLSMNGSRYRFSPRGVLHTAIKNRDAAGVDTLLELGAKPEIDFATFMTSYKTQWTPQGNTEDNKKQFRQNVEQPVITAIDCDMPSIVLKLLDAGADVNSLTGSAWRACADDGMYKYMSDDLGSVLDSVRNKIKDLKSFLEPESNSKDWTTGYTEPAILKDDAEYLEGHIPDSYAYWSTMKQIQRARKRYEDGLEKYKNWEKEDKAEEGLQEKRAAVEVLLNEFEALETQLLERGAKTFAELHPEVKFEDNYRQNYLYKYESEPTKPWQPLLSFKLPDLTDERQAAYIKLFQASWEGDLATIKTFTLAVWGENQSPLQVAVQDSNSFSPFSIAILRKHFDVARAILEIARAQYAPDGQADMKKYSLQSRDEDDDSEYSDEDDVQIYSQIVDDRFTLENIGEVQSQVKSSVSPLAFISWDCPAYKILEQDRPSSQLSNSPSGPFDVGVGGHWYGNRVPRSRLASSKVLWDAANRRTYFGSYGYKKMFQLGEPANLFQFAIYMDDSELLHFLIALCEDYTIRTDTTNETPPKFFNFSEENLLYAIGCGRIQILQEIIKRCGSGIPLDSMVKKSGIEIAHKPKYYQGLSIHGKKRADWANAKQEMQCNPIGAEHPLLLQAAHLGNLESVEWFLSDSPLRCYLEFADHHQDDVRIQSLANSKGGLEAVFGKWLNLRSHLLMHCVVLGEATEESLHLLRYLCKSHPEAMQHKSADGMTPLQVAFRLHSFEKAKILLEAGADQTCRNHAGDNIFHSMLNHDTLNYNDEQLSQIRELFNLVDKRLHASLFTERTTAGPSAATPLAHWLHTCLTSYHARHDAKTHWDKVLCLILDFTHGADLHIIDGQGDTPLHAAIRHRAPNFLQIMLDLRPELLSRENATGRTPHEMAGENYLCKNVFNDPPDLRNHAGSVLDRDACTFVAGEKDTRSSALVSWEICKGVRARGWVGGGGLGRDDERGGESGDEEGVEKWDDSVDEVDRFLGGL